VWRPNKVNGKGEIKEKRIKPFYIFRTVNSGEDLRKRFQHVLA